MKILNVKPFSWLSLGPLLLLFAFSIALFKFSHLSEVYLFIGAIIGFLFSLKGKWIGVFLSAILFVGISVFTFPEEWVWKAILSCALLLALCVTTLSFREMSQTLDGFDGDFIHKDEELETLRSSLREAEFALKKLKMVANAEKNKTEEHLENIKKQFGEMEQKLLQSEANTQQMSKELDASSKQLKHQLEEKIALLKIARVNLFQKEGELITLKKTLQEQELEMNGSERELIKNLSNTMQECDELEKEKVLLQDLVTDTIKAKKTKSKRSKSRKS